MDGHRQQKLARRREHQAVHDPRVRAGARAEYRREHGRQHEPDRRRREHGAERPQPRGRVGGVLEQVAGDEDACDEHDAVQEPVGRHDRERMGGGTPLAQVSRTVDKAACEVLQSRARRGGVGPAIGSEQVTAHPGRERRRGGEQQGGDRENRRVLAAARLEDEAEREPETGAQPCRRGPERRGERVGGEEQWPLDDARQRSRERREQEPVDRQVDERKHIDDRPDTAREQHERDRQRDHDAHQVAAEQHLAPTPPVEEHAGPRSDDRERE